MEPSVDTLKRRHLDYALGCTGHERRWTYTELPVQEQEEEDYLRIGILMAYKGGQPQQWETVKAAERILQQSGVVWLTPSETGWVVDADQLRKSFQELSSVEWLAGRAMLQPELEVNELGRLPDGILYEADVAVYLTPATFRRKPVAFDAPVEIRDSLCGFRGDNPDPSRVGFVMLRFGKTPAHREIAETVKGVLDAMGLRGIRSDDKQYHDDLFWNVATYMHGCGFGVAVFERLETDDFNPNVSLEVGYMTGIGKPVCLLKDKNIKTLHSDLMGRLYKPFDPQDPRTTIPPQLRQWLVDKGISRL
jgi:hypothetical protein